MLAIPLYELHKKNGVEFEKVNGYLVPKRHSNIKEEYNAVRLSMGISDRSHFTKIKISGSQAYEFTDFICPGDVGSIRDGQMLYSFILNEEGMVLTDVYICNDDEVFIILAEEYGEKELMDFLLQQKDGFDVEIEPFSKEYAVIAVDGPYSWELLQQFHGMELIGIPYLGFVKEEQRYLLRAGKSGEYCYKYLIPAQSAEGLWAKLISEGRKFDIKPVGFATNGLIRLENRFLNLRREGTFTRNPVELGLQWMIYFPKEEYLAKEGVEKIKKEGVKRKLIGVIVDTEIEQRLIENLRVYYKNEEIGVIANSGFSFSLNKYVALAYLDIQYAYVGIDLTAVSGGRKVPIRTYSTPFLLNKSFLINPQENSYFDEKNRKE